MKIKRKMGRPCISENKPRSIIIAARFDKTESDHIRQKAERSGLSLYDYVREKLLSEPVHVAPGLAYGVTRHFASARPLNPNHLFERISISRKKKV